MSTENKIKMIHILPINDTQPHEETSTCPCNPEVKIEEESGSIIVIHNAFDERECMETKLTLFLDYCNGHEFENPYATLLEIPLNVDKDIMRQLEHKQGAARFGGRWKDIMVDGRIPYKVISEGRKSDYSEGDYNEIYHLISGNY